MLCSRCKKRMAVVFMTRMEGDKTINEGLCLTCAKELGVKPVNDLLDKMGIGDDDIEAMSEQLMELAGQSPEGEESDFEAGGSATFPFLNMFQNGEVPETSAEPPKEGQKQPSKKKKGEARPKRKYLDTYCENLTQKALDGKLDNIVGRDSEVYRVTQILSRRTKNNPCLIGEPGVGKTAIAEGIAQRIASGNVPARLADKEIYLMDLTSLVAGTQFRGQFESRMKGLISEVKGLGNIILFIDEIHNLVGTGDSEGSMNAANILKPALSRGEIQVIGATTYDEYRKYIEKDAALERRFQPVKVEEPSIEDATEVLRGIKQYYERYHKVKLSDNIVAAAVEMSERYITDRFLPDKAIDLIDEACACASLASKELAEYEKLGKEYDALQQEQRDIESAQEKGEEIDYERLAEVKSRVLQLKDRLLELEPAACSVQVTEDDLATVIQLWTGIPASKIKETELQKVAGLEEAIHQKIVGQDEAVDQLCKAIKRHRVQLTDKHRPASFIFVGPTGVGKTELVKVMSSILFDSVDPLIRLDMSEYMEKHSVSKIIGSPPGYVGYDEAGQLTEKVRRKPYSVILLDEIEKAHPDVLNILLQILDEGRITDAHGRRVNFEKTIIVMTSNAGSERNQNAMGFAKTKAEVSRENAKKSLSEFLRPEFLGRVDEIIVFDPLNVEQYAKIAGMQMKELAESIAKRGIALRYGDDALRFIAQKAFDEKAGARSIAKCIRREVEDPVSELIVQQFAAPPTDIAVTVGEDGLIVAAM
ncbi:ATP-dependent Clp protease ATP-binding subunit [Bittarella massiliensis (ex Durand et al. 2017)]|uniref:AAA domain-containing protein n=2 Tax=Eubacteriales TaxID=186802 RepID=A0AAQ1RWW1_9FIRM|nr:ATP-dependent Clp protease ATP-binding subunit [Bittarella massiliensis (ex Durand et al. 2017)]MZL69846.1 AAA domain-containing protein [Bittarella massiliensis (ex Durand et al. 2017)]MZL81451.1 AAA domain-containing protein [Bittarella massiliensis (ex Durand et al. 2017)]SHG47791.1 ATP-dependent Clp protease ATP-binding subunit ClpA [Bittarella massiliensis (ex Durand et al. 2017)]